MLFLNSLPGCQNRVIYAALIWVMASTYVSSWKEILSNHERKEAIEQMVKKLGFGPDCLGLHLNPKNS